MTHDDIPIASAHFLDDPSLKSEEYVSVVQARVPDEKDEAGHNPTAITVPSEDVTVNNANPAPNNKPPVENSAHPEIAAFKERRKRNQKIALVTGFVVGCIICGPILGVIGAGATHAIVKHRGRAKQAKKEEQLKEPNHFVGEEGNHKELS
mmetsp:Transcript_14520/g.29406  ORF Transcript_14520/g.29406 Transcript_14520/m.29406 type:complete len:151 (+) Transcript_14520:1086-1538(+)|eukprot:scaffold3233_cov178-Amphora_coffeaeformis.AAC.3